MSAGYAGGVPDRDETTPEVLVVDLDGTALNAHGELEPEDVEAALALKESGVQVTIATGRLFTGTRHVAEALGVTGSVAVMDGRELIDVRSGEAQHARYVAPETRGLIREVLARTGLSAFLFRSRQIHHDRRDAHHAPYLGVWTRELVGHEDLFDAHEWQTASDVVAVCAIGEPGRVRAASEALAEALPPDLGTVEFDTFAGDRFLALRHAADDKGTALHRLAAERGSTAARTVAIGDWLNDVPMFRVAGRSFVMADARDDVKAAAGEVLDRPRHGGGAIAEVARRVWGVGPKRR